MGARAANPERDTARATRSAERPSVALERARVTRAGPARVWVFSELYHPEETSTGYILTRIAEGLARDFDVHAVCSQPTYSRRGLLAPYHEVHNGVAIERCRSTRLNKDVLALRAVNIASFTLAAFSKAVLRLRRDDLVLVVTNPPLLPYVVRLAAALRGARVVLLVHDVFPESIVAAGLARPGSLLVRALSRVSRALYRSMDRIVVLGRDMHALFARKVRGAEGRIVTIPNWGETELIRPAPAERDAVRKRLGLEDKFVVQFLGNIGRTHGVEALTAAALELRGDADIHFMFIGWGARRAWLEAEVAAKGLQNVSVLPKCTRAEVPVYLNACDIGVISFLPGMAGISVPSRMYNVMAAGKPILAVTDPDSELAMVVREERIGWIVPADRPERIADAVRVARRSPADLEQMGRRARAAAERRYSLESIEQLYRDLFADLHAAVRS